MDEKAEKNTWIKEIIKESAEWIKPFIKFMILIIIGVISIKISGGDIDSFYNFISLMTLFYVLMNNK